MNKIEKTRKEIFKSLNDAYIAIKEVVIRNGGFLNTSPEHNFDTIYGYAINEEDRLEEYYCYALRIVDNDILCYFLPIMRTYLETPTKEEMIADEDNWYCLDGSDGLTYKADTIISILDSIDEYDGLEEWEDVRKKISAILMDTDEEHPMKLSAVIGEEGACGLSSLELPEVDLAFQMEGEGIIYFHIYGDDDIMTNEKNWHELADFSLEDLKSILKALEEK